jgi:hypothetical protein
VTTESLSRRPLRADRWIPQDELLDSIIRKCINRADRKAFQAASGPEYAAALLVLAVLGVILYAGTENLFAAVAVPVVLAAGGLWYMISNDPPAPQDRIRILDPAGGAGGLPAGYLVHPAAWDAGMDAYLAKSTDVQLRVGTWLCRDHPGSVADLMTLVTWIDQQVPHEYEGESVPDDKRALAIYRIAAPRVAELAAKAPAKPVPTAKGRKSRKKK